jgi:branched-chain amino acid transport system permease protein
MRLKAYTKVVDRAATPLRRRIGPVLALALAALGFLGVLVQAFGAGLGSQGNAPTFLLITLNALTFSGLLFVTASG